MKRNVFARFGVVLAAGFAFFLTACSNPGSTGSSSSALGLAGTWTLAAASTMGHGNFSATAAVTQSGTGLGVNGSTTLSSPGGKATITQSGTTLSGTAENTAQTSGFTFTGTLSSGNLTLTASAGCGSAGTVTGTFTGTISSSSVKGTYKLTPGANCMVTGDAGTFTATKQ